MTDSSPAQGLPYEFKGDLTDTVPVPRGVIESVLEAAKAFGVRGPGFDDLKRALAQEEPGSEPPPGMCMECGGLAAHWGTCSRLPAGPPDALRTKALAIAARVDDELLSASPSTTAAGHALTELLEGVSDTLRALVGALPAGGEGGPTPFAGKFPEMSAGELLLRKLLWLRHGCKSWTLYGDDGEMQCATCMLDFRRMSARQIQERWQDRVWNALPQRGTE